MKVRFACPVCEFPALVDLPGPLDWQCARCDHRQRIENPDAGLTACVHCGNHELYKKKDFPHWLGMTILVLACVASVVTYGLYAKWWTWGILIGSAIFDGVLYLCVGDAIVCYRCNAHYQGFEANDSHKPHELGIAERYRHERIRKEQLKSQTNS